MTYIQSKKTFNMLLNALTLVSLIAGAQALGRAIVTNQCDAPIYLWSVGGSIGDQKVIAKDQSYSGPSPKIPSPVVSP